MFFNEIGLRNFPCSIPQFVFLIKIKNKNNSVLLFNYCPSAIPFPFVRLFYLRVIGTTSKCIYKLFPFEVRKKKKEQRKGAKLNILEICRK